MNIKYIILPVLLVIMSCNSQKKTVKKDSKIKETVKIPEIITEDLIVVLKNPNNLTDVKALITNSGLTWDKILYDNKALKVALIKVPSDKKDFWIEKLQESGEFKSVELNEIATAQNIIKKAETTFFTFNKTRCFGRCPVFEVTINNDGKVFYDGQLFVLVKGKHEFQLTNTQLSELKNRLSKTSFNNYKDIYSNPKIRDLPSTFVTYNNKQIQIKLWKNAPLELIHVTEYLEEILLAKKLYK